MRGNSPASRVPTVMPVLTASLRVRAVTSRIAALRSTTSFREAGHPLLHLYGHFRLVRLIVTVNASSRPGQCLSPISMRGFLGSPLIVLGKRLKLTRNVLVGHCSGSAEQSLCCF
jgi:hypothetical protein